MLQKLRRAMVDPERSLLEGVVEIDETEIPLRRMDDPTAGGRGRSRCRSGSLSAPIIRT